MEQEWIKSWRRNESRIYLKITEEGRRWGGTCTRARPHYRVQRVGTVSTPSKGAGPLEEESLPTMPSVLFDLSPCLVGASGQKPAGWDLRGAGGNAGRLSRIAADVGNLDDPPPRSPELQVALRCADDALSPRLPRPGLGGSSQRLWGTVVEVQEDRRPGPQTGRRFCLRPRLRGLLLYCSHW